MVLRPMPTGAPSGSLAFEVTQTGDNRQGKIV